jgi:hypothetical protein
MLASVQFSVILLHGAKCEKIVLGVCRGNVLDCDGTRKDFLRRSEVQPHPRTTCLEYRTLTKLKQTFDFELYRKMYDSEDQREVNGSG